MTLLSVERVEREPYDDVHWGPGPDGETVETHREPAPVEAFYELAVEADGERRTFDAEVRTGRGGVPQLDFGDADYELGDYMADHNLPESAWDVVCNAVFAVHSGDLPKLPLDLRSPPPGP